MMWGRWPAPSAVPEASCPGGRKATGLRACKAWTPSLTTRGVLNSSHLSPLSHPGCLEPSQGSVLPLCRGCPGEKEVPSGSHLCFQL